MKKGLAGFLFVLASFGLSSCSSDDNNNGEKEPDYVGTWIADKVTYEFNGQTHGPYEYTQLPGPDAVCVSDILILTSKEATLKEKRKANECEEEVSKGTVSNGIISFEKKEYTRTIDKVENEVLQLTYKMKMYNIEAPITVTYQKQ